MVSFFSQLSSQDCILWFVSYDISQFAVGEKSKKSMSASAYSTNFNLAKLRKYDHDDICPVICRINHKSHIRKIMTLSDFDFEPTSSIHTYNRSRERVNLQEGRR